MDDMYDADLRVSWIMSLIFVPIFLYGSELAIETSDIYIYEPHILDLIRIFKNIVKI